MGASRGWRYSLRCRIDDYEHRRWHALLGLVELIAGIVIVANPSIGYTTLAILVIAFILNGLATAALGWGLLEVREDASEAGPPVARAA